MLLENKAAAARALLLRATMTPTTPENPPQIDENSKDKALEPFREEATGTYFTTDQGTRLHSTDDSLHGGPRGPTLMEDFHLREKITHFDHERIPERAVHARGSAAHGYFQVYESMAKYTRAKVFQDPAVKTPVFVRFSTVVGSRGSADTVRDARGFATKFYTEEGNFDLVGNNIPVFFIQDGIKFPDLVHAVKPEPHNEMPQAASAHDTFWDFASLTPETTHMLMWVLSDRAIPRSYRMMEGFGVHTFRLINAEGKARFVKFHWKPLLGMHSLVWDEAQKIAGKDGDFHRRDLWEAIEAGNFPEYELGVQIIEAEDEHKFAFDLLDATKLVPEELVPVRRIGKMTLNRNPDNFFAETEQSAFHVGNVVPGIDFTNDPLFQARLFSYLDTQLLRLGGPNFAQIPINRPVVPVHNHQQDGLMQQKVHKGRVNYHPNSLGGGCPMMASANLGAFIHHAEKVEGYKIRERSDSFKDHYSQATLFWNSLSDPEKNHLVNAARFELGKVESPEIRQRVVDQFGRVDGELARRVAHGIGAAAPAAQAPANGKGPVKAGASVKVSAALSMQNTVKDTIKTRRIAILAAHGCDGNEVALVRAALMTAGAQVDIVSKVLGTIKTADGGELAVDKSQLTVDSILYDAVFVPSGKASVAALKAQRPVVSFIEDAFRHCKPIGASGEGIELLLAARVESGAAVADAKSAGEVVSDRGVVTVHRASDLGPFTQALVEAIAQHRHWEREEVD
jgi:catalase